MKKILLVAYHFPPNPSIGSRRWAKFAKHLAAQGHHVYVICSEILPEHVHSTTWLNDVQHDNIHVHRVHSSYPLVLRKQVTSFLDKLKYRFALRRVMREQLGTPYDYSAFWEKALTAQAEKIIAQEQIRNVIVTVAPFRSAYFITRLKEKNPSLNVIVDYRDPWSTGLAYGIPQLTSERKSYETTVEHYVNAYADHITSPHPDLLDELKTTFQGKSYHHLPHAFESTTQVAHHFQRDAEKIRLVFGGTIDLLNIEPVLKQLCVALRHIQKNKPTLFQKLEFIFYASKGKVYQQLQQSGLSCFRFEEPVSPEHFQEVCASADFLTIFLPDHLRILMITKSGEYLALRRPVLAFMEDGFFKTFYESNQLGFSLNRSNVQTRLSEILERYDQQTLQWNTNFDLSAFEYTNVTKQLVSYLV